MGNYGLKSKDGREIVTVMLVFGAISLTSTILRVVSRRTRNVSLGLDDYCMIGATFLIMACTVVVILMVTNGGVGLHANTGEVPFTDIQFNLKMLIACQVLYGTGLALVKTSMMTLYHKLFGIKANMQVAIYVTGAIVWAWALSIILESFLICHPVAFNWNPTLPGGGCGNRNAAFVIAGVLNMVTDFMVMALPIPYIWKLQLRIGRKIGLLVAFSIGIFVSAISMVRVVSLMNVDFNDLTYTLPIPLMWSMLEQQLAIVAANLPLLRRVFSNVLPRSWLGSSAYGTGTPSGELSGKKPSARGYSLTRMDAGANRSEITSESPKAAASNPQTRWSDDDGQSDTELTVNAMPPDGIQMWKDFRVDSTRSLELMPDKK
ncbi:uncharacterized protein N7479_003582 [Penicillium vulpinum]|uniref:Rhodopsin domain-containing protein n=1 Tax=Penicillium vulpinum TaxID=29845 RepID=A0A1V6RWE8_9EURO|nr:uncharacterized protein N7479_003582 [Penicillium vulpinum]KAJ5963706.1 hypothetical protein N7479_003582 [Penicillium vulpinum]OQE06111.1 hypothetical protein PENVUL_c020G08223 [Penicillium vulpinum]